MNFLTVGARLNRQMRKLRTQYEAVMSAEDAAGLAERATWMEYEENVRTGLEAMTRFQEIAGITGGRWFWITIRPPTGNFQEFYTLVGSTVRRKCFLEYRLSFEQKGVDESTLGEGYHVHMVARMTQRSVGEIVRDLKSSFKLGDEAIEVKKTKNPHVMFEDYCISYESKDGHKETTREWDKMWREQQGLLESYNTKTGVPSARVEQLT